VLSVFIAPVVTAIDQSLVDVDGVIVVLGKPKIARALAARGRRVVVIGSRSKDLRKLGLPALVAGESLPLASGSCGALVAGELAKCDDWQALAAEWLRVVADRGVIVCVERAEPAEVSRRVLCAGLTAIEQRRAGRALVTSGVVVTLPDS
jgi:hypothetical protein